MAPTTLKTSAWAHEKPTTRSNHVSRRGYPVLTKAPQSAVQALLSPSGSVAARLDALDQARAQRIARLHHAAELKHEGRVRLARQHLIDGSVDIVGCRAEVAAADAALAVELRDVPPIVSRVDLQDEARAVITESKDVFYDKKVVALEKQAAAWTPAPVEQAEGGRDDE